MLEWIDPLKGEQNLRFIPTSEAYILFERYPDVTGFPLRIFICLRACPVTMKKQRIGFITLLILFIFSPVPATAPEEERASPSSNTGKREDALQAPAPEKLRFGLTPYLPKQILEKGYQPLMDYLSSCLNMPVLLTVEKNYEELGKQLKYGNVDIAIFSPLSYVEAKKKDPTIRLLLSPIVAGSTTYTAYIIVHYDSGIHRLEQLKDQDFAFVDQHSTSGYLFPYAFFVKNGIVPENYFNRLVYAGNHLKAIQCVADRSVAAAAVYSDGLRAARLAGIPTRSLRILKKTGRIPYDAVCARAGLNPDRIRQVREILLDLDTRNELGRKILGETIRITGWIEVRDDHYDSVRDVLDLVEQQKITISSAEK